LDFMVLFSSTSALLGSLGQANYSAANSALDAHAKFWQQSGSKVWSIQWGPWRDAGMAAQKGTVQRLKAQGLGSISNVVGMSALCGVLSASGSLLAACPVHWNVYLKQFGKSIPPFLSRFKKEMGAGQAQRTEKSGSSAASVAISSEQLQALVQATAAEVTGSATINPSEPLMRQAWIL